MGSDYAGCTILCEIKLNRSQHVVNWLNVQVRLVACIVNLVHDSNEVSSTCSCIDL